MDDATFSVGVDTEFSFDNYVFDGDAATPDSATMSLRRGCVRSVSGQIDAPDARLDTPYASLAIEAVFLPQVRSPVVYVASVSDRGVFLSVHNGSALVANAPGSLRLGQGGAYDHGRVLQDMAPEGLVDSPVAMTDCTPQQNGAASSGSDRFTGSRDFSSGP